jgi:isoaspartyl peptidase/L-asparaginase-like protein (Ntn-hydrolase superfamily)
VKERAASIAHFSESAVTSMAVPLIGNASAKVSSMTTPLRVIAVDGAGNIAMPFNSQGMYRGSVRQGSAPETNIY